MDKGAFGCVSSPSLVKTEKMAESFILFVKKKRPIYSLKMVITAIILLHEKFLQFNWLRAVVVFMPNITTNHAIIYTNTTRPITTAALRRVSAKPNIPSYLE